MSRLMSVALTEDAVRDRTKTVTRRLGWRDLEPGDRLTLCRKVQGRRRKDGTVEPLVRLADVQIVSVRREPLDVITPADVAREGFPAVDGVGGWMAVEAFIRFFCHHMRCTPDTEVSRIEWRYLDTAQASCDDERGRECGPGLQLSTSSAGPEGVSRHDDGT